MTYHCSAELLACGVQVLPRRRDDSLAEPEAFGDGYGMALAGRADQQVERGRHCLGVELDGGIVDAIVVVRVGFQHAKVRRHYPEAPDLGTDLDNLKRKVDAGAEFLISQLFFDNDDFLAFRDRARRAGIGVPIIAGIMPILSVRQIKRFTQMCGARIPQYLLKRIEAVEDDAEAVRHVGMYYSTRQCLGLLEQNVAGIHFYTLNRSTATRAIYQLINADLKPRSTPAPASQTNQPQAAPPA